LNYFGTGSCLRKRVPRGIYRVQLLSGYFKSVPEIGDLGRNSWQV